MIVTVTTERDGHVSYSSETALRYAVTRFVDDARATQMIIDARPSRADFDEEDDMILPAPDRHVVCTSARQAWEEVRRVLHAGGHLELEARPRISADTEDSGTAAA